MCLSYCLEKLFLLPPWTFHILSRFNHQLFHWDSLSDQHKVKRNCDAERKSYMVEKKKIFQLKIWKVLSVWAILNSSNVCNGVFTTAKHPKHPSPLSCFFHRLQCFYSTCFCLKFSWKRDPLLSSLYFLIISGLAFLLPCKPRHVWNKI